MLMFVSAVAEQTALVEIEHRLAQEFPDVAPGDVEAAVRHAHARFDASPIRDFIALFVEKNARRHLTRHDMVSGE
jgi:hypothetical protein